ncbi:unnamed protein product [Orchesella dallaii]|uniref:C2H2-type domain-containing protein n=1 Tax=Orchesella dallaii TaxID=48710 RepID=A0ABP1RX97_9HEXA
MRSAEAESQTKTKSFFSVILKMTGTYKNSLCVFCFKPASPLSRVEDKKDEICSSKFLQFFKSYLKILPQVGFDYENVTCIQCQKVGESFSELFMKWDSLTLELDWKVSLMLEKMKQVGVSERIKGVKSQLEKGEEKEGDGDNNTKAYQDILKLRKELLLGCKEKLGCSTPKVRLNSLSEKNGEEGEGNTCDTPKRCDKLVQTGGVPLKKRQLRKGLMTFIAILHLSIPFHLPKSQSNQSKVVANSNQTQKKEKTYWRVDKGIQTCAIEECHSHNEKEDREQEPPTFSLEPEAVQENLQSTPLPPSSSSKVKKCLLCQSKFKSSTQLKLHMQSAHKYKNSGRQRPRKVFKCEKCNSIFETRAKLHAHTFHMHEQAKILKRKQKPTKNMCVREVLRCPLCPARCKSQEDLSIHARLEHQRILAYECAHCATKLKTVEGVRSHMKFFHGKTFKTVEILMSANNVNYGFVGSGCQSITSKTLGDFRPSSHPPRQQGNLSSSPIRLAPQLFSSPISNQIFNEKQQKPASKPSTSTKPSESDTLQLVSSLIESYKLPNILTKNFQCNFEGCTKKFSTKSQLHSHQRVHNSNTSKTLSLACLFPGCSSKFASKINRRKHYFSKHTIEALPVASPFRCQICTNSFPTAAGLAQHLDSHDDVADLARDKNFRAHFSPKRDKTTELIAKIIEESFPQQEQKEQDDSAKIIPVITLDSESSNKPEEKKDKSEPLETFKCPQCPASFKVAALFSSHLKREHNQETIVKFGCTPCAKEFDASKEFVYHMFKVHGKVLEVQDGNCAKNKSQEANKKVWKYVCPAKGCDVFCASKEELMQHFSSHATVKASEALDLAKYL